MHGEGLLPTELPRLVLSDLSLFPISYFWSMVWGRDLVWNTDISNASLTSSIELVNPDFRYSLILYNNFKQEDWHYENLQGFIFIGKFNLSQFVSI